jgi:hypothetical protein
VSGIRVFLHVVGGESTFEHTLKLVGDTLPRDYYGSWDEGRKYDGFAGSS